MNTYTLEANSPFKHLKDKKVLLTGSASMLGMATMQALQKRDAIIIPLFHKEYDLLSLERTRRAFIDWTPEYVIHLAGYNGNIGFNLKYPADIFYRTTQIGLNVLKVCQEFGVHKVVSIISSCAYPDTQNEILLEGTLWNGKPNDTVECHGFAKRTLDAYSRQLYKQFGLNAVSIVINNSYEVGDSYDLNKTKVVGSLIKKVVDAHLDGSPSITCFGSGLPKREFVFSEDAGEAIVQALEKHNDPFKPLNIGSGSDITIFDLVWHIVNIVGYKGEVLWDRSKPDGQMKKMLDISTMKNLIELEPVGIREGLKQTIDWYIKNREELCKSE